MQFDPIALKTGFRLQYAINNCMYEQDDCKTQSVHSLWKTIDLMPYPALVFRMCKPITKKKRTTNRPNDDFNSNLKSIVL